jgi:twitching motility protein PilI
MTEHLESLTEQDQSSASDIQSLYDPEGELYLRFYLSSNEEFALPAIAFREVMQQNPDRIIPIPNTSPLLLGTMNLRGQVIWVADLGQFLGDKGILKTDRNEIPVIAVEDQETILGLAVDRLGGMEWLDAEQLKAVTNASDQISPYVLGAWHREGNSQNPLCLLDYLAILRSARWAS